MSDFTATPTMGGFMLSMAYVRVLAGPIGGGKSVCCAHELFRWATSVQEPNHDGARKTRFLIVRNTADQLRSTTMKTVFDWFPPGVVGEWKATEKTLYLDFLLPDKTRVKSEWMFIALDTPDDIRKALSLEATGLWGNECRELHPDVVDALLGRINRYPSMKDGGATRAGAIFDTNMPDLETWWQDKMEHPPKNWSIHIQPPAIITHEEYLGKYLEEPDEARTAEAADGTTYAVDPASDNYANLHRTYYPNLIPGKSQDYLDVYLRCRYGRALNGFPVYDKTFRADFHIAAASLLPIKSESYPVVIGLDFGRCYDDQTDVLTRTGWKRFAEVSDTEEVATLNPETFAFEYTRINFKVEFDYDGDMLCWDGTNLNLCVTPEHRFPYTNRESQGVLRWASAEELSSCLKAHKYAVIAPDSWQGVSPSDLPLGLSAVDYARFLGWWMGDGCVEAATNRVQVSQKKPAPALSAVVDSLTAAGVKVHHQGTGFRFSSQEMAEHLRPFGGKHAGGRRVPDCIMQAPQEVLLEFVLAYTYADGHIRAPRREGGREEHTIWFNNPEIAGQFQEIGQKLGWGSSLRWQKGGVSTFSDGRQVECSGGWVVQFKRGTRRAELLPRQFSRRRYTGKIYCLNVPYHTLCVRREGKVSWNGNTPAAIMMQMTPIGRLHIMSEVVSENMGIETFIATKLRPHLFEKYQGCTFIVAPDPAGWAKTQVGEVSPVDVVKRSFKVARPPTNKPSMRIEAVETLLAKQIDGKAALLIDPVGCPVLTKGFRFGYRWKASKKGEIEAKEPEKNAYSHPHDGCQYGVMVAVAGRLGAALSRGRREVERVSAAGWS